MSEAKHTPGPWMIATSCSYRRVISESDTPVAVPIVQHSDGHPDIYFPNGGEDGPDAHLIAAAPDLLAALEDLLAICDGDPDEPEELEWARAAIARAKGEF